MISKLITFTVIPTFGLAVVLASCGSSISDNPNKQTTTSTPLANNSFAPNNIFGIKGEDIVIRIGPGKKFDKIINEKATEVMHKIQYATVDHSCKVREDEIKDGWSKIVVIDPDWLSESHKGWIESKHIIKTDERAAETVAPRKNKIFNEVSEIQSRLSSVGIGKLRQWNNDSYGWMSLTPYYSFGSASTDNGMQSNLAYYLESKKSEAFIETIMLVLNINNSSEKSQALSLLDNTSQKTFSALKLKMPKGLSTAIKSGSTFNSDNSDFKVSLTLDKSKIDTWKLTIEAK